MKDLSTILQCHLWSRHMVVLRFVYITAKAVRKRKHLTSIQSSNEFICIAHYPLEGAFCTELCAKNILTGHMQSKRDKETTISCCQQKNKNGEATCHRFVIYRRLLYCLVRYSAHLLAPVSGFKDDPSLSAYKEPTGTTIGME